MQLRRLRQSSVETLAELHCSSDGSGEAPLKLQPVSIAAPTAVPTSWQRRRPRLVAPPAVAPPRFIAASPTAARRRRRSRATGDTAAALCSRATGDAASARSTNSGRSLATPPRSQTLAAASHRRGAAGQYRSYSSPGQGAVDRCRCATNCRLLLQAAPRLLRRGPVAKQKIVRCVRELEDERGKEISLRRGKTTSGSL